MRKEIILPQGFFRIKIGEEKNSNIKIIGDSGWKKNEVTNLGFQNYICALMGSLAGSVHIGAMAIGTGTTPGVAATALDGETKRQSCGNSIISSKTLQATLAIASANHPGGTPTIQNVALLNSTASGGTIFSGGTYSTSQWQTNQGLSATYQLRFATSS